MRSSGGEVAALARTVHREVAAGGGSQRAVAEERGRGCVTPACHATVVVNGDGASAVPLIVWLPGPHPRSHTRSHAQLHAVEIRDCLRRVDEGGKALEAAREEAARCKAVAEAAEAKVWRSSLPLSLV